MSFTKWWPLFCSQCGDTLLYLLYLSGQCYGWLIVQIRVLHELIYSVTVLVYFRPVLWMVDCTDLSTTRVDMLCYCTCIFQASVMDGRLYRSMYSTSRSILLLYLYISGQCYGWPIVEIRVLHELICYCTCIFQASAMDGRLYRFVYSTS